MTEIRKHYFLDKQCIIADNRSKRPSDFKKKTSTEPNNESCPFCPGNEYMNPDTTLMYGTREKWLLRCFPNLYPVLPMHEVIVETPYHNKHIPDFTDEEINLLMEAYLNRTKHYFNKNDIKYVSIFKNHGKAAGASLSHPHSQIIPMPFVPPSITEEMLAIEEIGHCPFCDIVKQESGGSRVISENEDWIVIAPYYSKTPFEMCILPKNHISNITEVKDIGLLGITIRDTLTGLKTLLDDPAYNFMIFQMDDNTYHFSIRIESRLSINAGFELNTDVYVNSVSPEKAARLLREVNRTES